MRRKSGRAYKVRGGFTLIELMVVIAIIGILASLLLPVLSRGKSRARRIQCMNNLHQMGIGMHMYAEESRDLLPDCTTNYPKFYGSVWPWDLNTNVTDSLEARGVPRQLFYCPTDATKDDDKHWNFWKYRSAALPPIRIVGYVFLLNGCVQVPQELWRKNILGDGTNSPSKTEMVIDAVGSQNGHYIPLQGTWVERSNHLNGQVPEGGNIAFEDGHSEWRNFKLMQHRIYGDVVWDF